MTITRTFEPDHEDIRTKYRHLQALAYPASNPAAPADPRETRQAFRPGAIVGNAHRIYDYMRDHNIGPDSATREAAYAAADTGLDSDVLYNAWLNEAPIVLPCKTCGTVIDVIDHVKTDDRSLDTDEYAGMIFDVIDNAPANRVWVLAIEHRHGTDLTAHHTEDHARQWLREWVGQWWHEIADLTGDLAAIDETEAVEAYFAARDDEFYSLTDTPVLT